MVAQLGDMVVGGRSKFNIDQVLTGAINNTVAAFSSNEFGTEDLAKAPVWKDAVNNELDDLESGLTNSLIDHDRFNLLDVETNVLGQTFGQQVGVKIGEEGKRIYTEMKQGAQNSSGSTTVNSPSSSGNNNANNNPNNNPQSANSQNNNSPATYGSSNSDNNAISDALSRYGFFGSSSNNTGIGFGAVDPNYDDSMPTYGTGNDTPTSKQAPVNTTTTSAGQYVQNAVNNVGRSLWQSVLNLDQMDFGTQQGIMDAATFSSTNINQQDAFYKAGYAIGLGIGAIPQSIVAEAMGIPKLLGTGFDLLDSGFTSLASKFGLFSENIADNSQILRMNPADIRFTQSDVSPYFTDGSRVDTLINNLVNGSVSADNLPAIRVVNQDGSWYSLDNRRLVAFNSAGLNDIPVTQVSLDDPSIQRIFDARFDPIDNIGNYIVMAQSSIRTETQQLLVEYGKINGVQLEY